MSGLKWNTGKLYYSTVELGYQHQHHPSGCDNSKYFTIYRLFPIVFDSNTLHTTPIRMMSVIQFTIRCIMFRIRYNF